MFAIWMQSNKSGSLSQRALLIASVLSSTAVTAAVLPPQCPMTSSTASLPQHQLNVVQLSSENIELRMRIDKAEEIIDGLRLKLSQSLAGKCAPGGSPGVSGGVTAEEYDALEAELEDARQREERLKATVHQLQQERNESTPQRRRALSMNVASPSSATSHEELTAARRRIEALEASEKKLKAAVDDLNDALENVSINVDDSGASPPSHECDPSAHNQIQQQELEEAKKAMSVQRAEYERRLQEALSERNIALRVKTEALKEAASARTEVERLRGLPPKFKHAQPPSDSGESSPSQNDVQMLRDQVQFLESRLAAAGKELDAAQKDAARAHRAGKRAFLERQSALKDLESWKADQMKAMKEKITESSMTSQAFQGMQQTQVDSCVQSAAQKIGAIQERLLVALVQRDELHNHYHVHHNSPNGAADHSSSDGRSSEAAPGGGSNCIDVVGGGSSKQSPAAAMMPGTATAGPTSDMAGMLLGGDDWAHMMYEAFFAYERQIYNLKAEVLSLQAIAVMSGDDADKHWKQKVSSMQEEMDVLRNAAQEYRAAAGRPHATPPAPSGSFGYNYPTNGPYMPPSTHYSAVPYVPPGGVATAGGDPSGGPYSSSVYIGYPVAS